MPNAGFAGVGHYYSVMDIKMIYVKKYMTEAKRY